MSQLYNDPAGGTASTMGPQIRTDYYDKKAVIDAVRKQTFIPLADSRSMPKHMGKTIKVYQYVPLLDDRNSNTLGLDANGAVYANGNLYGSSRDVGTITGKMPLLSESGGRVNRVGFTRMTLEGSMYRLGIYTNYTQESLDFDTDAELYQHNVNHLVGGVGEMQDDLVQADLLTNAGVIQYSGTASSRATISGEVGGITQVTYADLKRLSTTLDQNRTPKHTKIIKGSLLTDTKTIEAARFVYIGPELETTFENMLDGLGNPAFKYVREYADAAEIMSGEIGSVAGFRIIVVQEMMRWEGEGAAVTNNAGYSETGGNYNVHPILVVGSEAFATVGLQTSGKKGSKNKFDMKILKPGVPTSDDPYGTEGIASISFWHGFLATRPERIGLILTVAPE